MGAGQHSKRTVQERCFAVRMPRPRCRLLHIARTSRTPLGAWIMRTRPMERETSTSCGTGVRRPLTRLRPFRVAGRAPELWNALDGVTPQMIYQTLGGRTTVPLHLEPFGSVFVVFARPENLHATGVLKDGHEITSAVVSGDEQTGFAVELAEAGMYRVPLSDGRMLTAQVASSKSLDLPAGQWTVEFQADRGAPAGPQPLKSFESWTESAHPGVRVTSPGRQPTGPM